MITENIKTTPDGEEFITYGIKGKCGEVVYDYDDISANKIHAEILDSILANAKIPGKMIARVVEEFIGIFSEYDI